jgi:fructosamine-3-kinase
VTPAPELEAAVLAALGATGAPAYWRAAGNSTFNASWRLDCGAGSFFVKSGPRERHAMLDGEAAGLAALAATQAMRVPAVAALGGTERHAFLALEWLDLARGGRDAALGRALAALHRCTGERFGWTRDNTIGRTPPRTSAAAGAGPWRPRAWRGR